MPGSDLRALLLLSHLTVTTISTLQMSKLSSENLNNLHLFTHLLQVLAGQGFKPKCLTPLEYIFPIDSFHSYIHG